MGYGLFEEIEKWGHEKNVKVKSKKTIDGKVCVCIGQEEKDKKQIAEDN